MTDRFQRFMRRLLPGTRALRKLLPNWCEFHPARAAGTRAEWPDFGTPSMRECRAMTASIGIGLVGAGRMGSVHGRLIARSVPNARLAAIADVNLEAARRVAAELGDPPSFASLDDML